eukprot:8990994-Pyramimonas_sp.AAC.1
MPSSKVSKSSAQEAPHGCPHRRTTAIRHQPSNLSQLTARVRRGLNHSLDQRQVRKASREHRTTPCTSA